MSVIAEQAGVAAGTLYRYFESKQQLAQALGEELMQRMSLALAPILLGLSGPEDVERLVRTAVEVAASDREVLRIAQVDLLSMMSPSTKSARRKHIEAFGQFLEGKMDAGVIQRSPATALADYVGAILLRLVLVCLVWEEGSLDEYGPAAVRMLQAALFGSVN
jgi:AcrR family transcriptional regulator